MLKEILGNELDSCARTNYHVVKNLTIEKILEEGSRRAEKEINGKSKKKKTKEKKRAMEKTYEKAREKVKKKKSNLLKLNFIVEKTCSISKGTI